jgi:monofunctional biosynthetic peptidoglycan transglycosylase
VPQNATRRIPRGKQHSSGRSGWLWRIVGWTAAAVLACLVASAVLFCLLRFVNPPVTVVQIQRRVEAMGSSKPYRSKSAWVPLSRISPDLQHAVVAAEDGRFYEHRGIDWKQVQIVVDEARESGEVSRGASTITQQLVKNLLFTTHRNPIRKAAEWVLAPMADTLLGKQRTLELYLNVVEWGDGVWGAEAAAQSWFGVPASRLSREQAARLAAILPNPRRRKPARMNEYSGQILVRMRQQGW